LRYAEGQHAAARATLDEARTTFDHLGARPALARCDALADRLSGEAAASTGIHAPARLTAREVEVLRLIAAGLSNREMAAALCRSERTVERHIENIYRKIDARSKADATAFVFRHHLA
jgi:DNA-binding NarL/FixJ family response regulator